MKKYIRIGLVCLVIGGIAFRAEAGSALGDWGHFLSYTPTVHFNNPEGVPFTITVRVMRHAGTRLEPCRRHYTAVGGSGRKGDC